MSAITGLVSRAQLGLHECLCRGAKNKDYVISRSGLKPPNCLSTRGLTQLSTSPTHCLQDRTQICSSLFLSPGTRWHASSRQRWTWAVNSRCGRQLPPAACLQLLGGLLGASSQRGSWAAGLSTWLLRVPGIPCETSHRHILRQCHHSPCHHNSS